MKRKVTYLLIISILLVSGMSNSQTKNNPLPKPGADPHPELPIDSSITFLLIIGTVYGIYKSQKK
ncbi:hypothetical protein BX611_0569 [Lutibacter oceani]|uniref:Secreted protein with PEP-CTERM sorting signal n=1 Tax=Lutibacter oceani TaxID=1853311 RepID=A0A3D9S3W2_9FLAO|nr:hypothetical protein [Lutibacter oceani]REE83282.1 hypothetical protein BX611_0569 [Lutibacter oceani]